MDKLEVMRTVVDDLYATERSIDDAIAQSTDFIATLIQSRRDVNLSAVVGAVEGLSGTELMPADVYYISGVPSVVVAEDVVRIAVVAFVLCLLATLYPAWRASRTDPATALRYE